MIESTDLAKIADLLSLNSIGVFNVNALEVDAWISARHLRRDLPGFEELLWEGEPTINVVPYKRAGEELLAPSSIIWGRTESKAAADRLRGHKPLPDVVIREGSDARLIAFWALSEDLVAHQVEDANKKIAKLLNQGRYGTADAGFRFPLPGSVLRYGRGSQVPVTLEHWRPGAHTLEEVVGHLEAPLSDEAKREMWEAAVERKAQREAREKARTMRQLEAAGSVGHES